MSLFVLLITAATAATPGERLATLRAEVDTLRGEVRRDQADLEARLSSLASARGDAEVELAGEERALERIRADLARARTEVADADPHAALLPAVRTGLSNLRAHIGTGIPFRAAERLAAIDTLEADVTSGRIPTDKAVSRVWQALEDELALQRESAVDRQVITLSGEEHLAQIARIGMVALYWRTEDGAAGWWTVDGFVEATTRDERADVEAIFTALERRIRSGWFDLPGQEVP